MQKIESINEANHYEYGTGDTIGDENESGIEHGNGPGIAQFRGAIRPDILSGTGAGSGENAKLASAHVHGPAPA
jgi:hypothetical protein